MALTLNGSSNVITPVSAVQPAGAILQVVSSSTTTSFSTSSTSFVDLTGMSIAITPTSSSSKILILTSINADYVAQTNVVNLVSTQLLRGSTAIATKATYMGVDVSNNGYCYVPFILSYMDLDSPSTTSSTTYKVQGKLGNSNNNAEFRINIESSNMTSELIAMEIAA